jgi:hypothetical protein
VSPKGTVILRADKYVIRGRIANLSRNGLAAIIRATVPERLLGSAVALSLRFDGRDSSWIEASGRVLRIGAGTIAISLVVTPPAFARIIEETISASHHRDRVLAIVLVDAMARRRNTMAEGFRAAGCAVVAVATPLEAIVRLGESHFEPDLIAIADSSPTAISDELRRFVDVEHPRAKLVTIGDATSAPTGLAHWLSAENPGRDLEARIRKILVAFDPQ